MQVVEQIRLKKADIQYVNDSYRALLSARLILSVMLIDDVQVVAAV